MAFSRLIGEPVNRSAVSSRFQQRGKFAAEHPVVNCTRRGIARLQQPGDAMLAAHPRFPLAARHRRSMQLAAHFKPWRLLPGYAINGIAVAVGIGGIQLLASAVAGAYAAQLVVSGATCASLAD